MALGSSTAIKRRNISDSFHPAKKIKKNEVPRVIRKQYDYRKRNVMAVVCELHAAASVNDRASAKKSLYELSVEHLGTTYGSLLDDVAEKLVHAAAVGQVDLGGKILRSLLTLMRNARNDQWCKIIQLLSSESVCNNFIAKRVLDHKLLALYTEALSCGYIDTDLIPKSISRCAERCLVQSSVELDGAQRRVAALEFLIAFANSGDSEGVRIQKTERTLCHMLKDRDFRVRSCAIQGLIAFIRNEKMLSFSTYTCVNELLDDVDNRIRLAVLELLVFFANKRPKEAGTSLRSSTVPDDAFSAVCNAMNDIDVDVRAEAAKRLGEFESVSDDLLFQTLDKKMMRSNKLSGGIKKVEKSLFSMSKAKKDSSKQVRWKFTANKNIPKEEVTDGWSRGKELHAKCPTSGASEAEPDSIIPQGACGAFVTALEDEFMRVRKAAVYSLGKLAASRPTFAITALEYLADMFNDEIAAVRLDAIKALTPLIAHSQLSTDQLAVILKCLDDAMGDSRQAMMDLLKRASFADINCINLCVKAMLQCLQRFPEDQNNIFECMAQIGTNHAVLVQSMARRLLDLHSLFHAKEQSIDDVKYLTKLILVLNAATRQETIVTLLPTYVRAHYRFLRSSLAHLVQPIRLLDDLKKEHLASFGDGGERAAKIVSQTYQRLLESNATKSMKDRAILRRNISRVYRDAQAITAYNNNVSGAARLVYCLSELNVALDNVSQLVLCGGESADALNAVEQHFIDLQCIESQFSGISDSLTTYVVHCRLYLSMLETAATLLDSPNQWHHAIDRGLAALALARERLEYSLHAEQTSAFIAQLSAVLEDFSTKKLVTASALSGVLVRFHPQLPSSFPRAQDISLKWAEIVKPNKDAALENAIKFISGLPHAINVEVELHNLSAADYDYLRIKIAYPDGYVMHVKPRPTDFKVVNEKDKLFTQVMVTASNAWIESAEVVLTVVLLTGLHSGATSVPLFGSPTCTSSASVRVKIQPVSRK